MFYLEDLLVMGGNAVDRIRESRKAHAVYCYVAEAVKMAARASVDLASRATVTMSHGPVSVTIAPKGNESE